MESEAGVLERFERQSVPFYTNQDTNVSVYKGVDKQQPGVTIVWKERICDLSTCESLTRTYEQLRQFRHPNICEVLAVAHRKVDPSHYRHVLITLWCENDLAKDIGRRLSHGQPYSEKEAFTILAEMVDCLAYCQLMGVSHRDIKPANIFQTADRVLKLGDFDTMRSVEHSIRTYTLTGTLPYFSPALRRGYAVGDWKVAHNPIKSDVYSLGVTLLEVLLLRTPELSAIETHLRDLRVSDGLRDILRAMLTIDERQRPDFLELAKKLSIVPLDAPSSEKCATCAEAATCFCICSFPIVCYCKNCSDAHNKTTGAHAFLLIGKRKEWNSSEKVQSVRAKLDPFSRMKNELQERKREIEEKEVEVRTNYERLVKEIEEMCKRDMRLLAAQKAKIRELQTLLASLLVNELTQRIDVADQLSRFPLPIAAFTHYGYPSIASNPQGNFTISHRFAQLSSILEPLAYPVPALGNKLYLWRPGRREWQEKDVDAEVSMDADTMYTRLSGQEIVGAGGLHRPKQVFILDIYKGTAEVECDMLRERATPGGAICVEGVLYLFAGGNSELSERLRLRSNAIRPDSLPELPENLTLFNPSHHQGSIYLPCRKLYSYDIAKSAYKILCNLHRVTGLVSSVLVNEVLYVFTDRKALEVDLKRNKVKKNDCVCECWSNPEPCVRGNCAYFPVNAPVGVLEIDLRSYTQTAFNLS